MNTVQRIVKNTEIERKDKALIAHCIDYATNLNI